MNSREKFEAWWEINYHNGNPPRFGWAAWREDGGYKVDDDESELDAMWNAWQAATNALEVKCAALAAENAALKSAIDEHSDCFTACPCCGTEHDCSHDDICRVLNETPATDAFLAEVRAQGVEMFVSKCKEESKRAHSSDARDSWWVSGEEADDFAAQLRQGASA